MINGKLLLPIAVAQFIAWIIIGFVLWGYTDNSIFAWFFSIGAAFYVALWITNIIMEASNDNR